MKKVAVFKGWNKFYTVLNFFFRFPVILLFYRSHLKPMHALEAGLLVGLSFSVDFLSKWL